MIAPRADGAPSRASLWMPVVFCMGLMFVMSSLSQPPSPTQVSDKTQHFLAYGGLGLVTLRATARGRAVGVSAGTALAAWAIAAVYGLTDELHQGFVPGRSADAADALADALGAAAAIAVALAIIRGSRAASPRG